MIIVKNSQEQIILKESGRRRVISMVFSGLFAVGFIVTGLILLAMGESWGIGCFLGSLFFGVLEYWTFFDIIEITFDHNLGQLSVRTGAKPFFRTRRILRNEISGVELKYTHGYGSCAQLIGGQSDGVGQDLLKLVLRVGPNKKKVWELLEANEKTTKILANRIEAFWNDLPQSDTTDQIVKLTRKKK